MDKSTSIAGVFKISLLATDRTSRGESPQRKLHYQPTQPWTECIFLLSTQRIFPPIDHELNFNKIKN